MIEKPKVLFLYTELAEYFLACLRALVERHVEIHVVHWSVKAEAPFVFSKVPGVHFHDRNAFSTDGLLELAGNIDPDAIFCSGWIDKGYLKVCGRYSGKVPTVLLLDNQWDGSFRQRIGTWLGPVTISPRFSHAWVPGQAHLEFANRMGFAKGRIETDFYCADTPSFKDHYEAYQSQKAEAYPRRFLYVGRYTRHKGVLDLWEAFAALREETGTDWELCCVGTGDLYEERKEYPGIRHVGFVQPGDLGPFIRDSGVFINPAHFEPWGVAVHEFAAAGMPLICSDRVGAAERFLSDGDNGRSFPHGDVEALKDAMGSMIAHSDKELLNMGSRSVDKAQEVTPAGWAEKVMGWIGK